MNTLDGNGAIAQKSTGIVTTGTIDLAGTTFNRVDLEGSSIDAENCTISNGLMVAASQITATGTGTISNQNFRDRSYFNCVR